MLWRDICFVTADLAARLDAAGELENVLCLSNGDAEPDSAREKAFANRPVLVVAVVGCVFFDGFRTNAIISLITLRSLRSCTGDGGFSSVATGDLSVFSTIMHVSDG